MPTVVRITVECVLLTTAAILQLQLSSATSEQYNLEQSKCPVWQERNATGNCSCSVNLKDIVICKEPNRLSLMSCYCMTNGNNTVVGPCQYTCRRTENGYVFYFPIHALNDEIDQFMCKRYKRKGQMCGSCEAGYAPPVYSYSLSCVNCTTSNWAKYMAVSLLPLTAFFVLVIIFRISATSPTLHGFILCIQIILCPANLRVMSFQKLAHDFLELYTIWNLDLFRLVYTPFCLHPDTSTLQVLALDYIIAVYPLLLIGLSYLLVLLYDHNVHLIVCLWKPFVPLFIRFRRQWNIRNSLVDAFATFFLLSYVKILSVSVDLLMPVVLYDQHGHSLPQLYLFNQGDVAFLGSHHLPYACLAIFFLLTFTLLPMFLLFLYPCSCFQRCLNHTGCSCHSLHIFMDTFQGHYKNGTNGTRDYRFFSGLYLLLRAAVYASIMITYQTTSYTYTTVMIATLAVSIALFQPYRRKIINSIDTILLITTALLYNSLAPLTFMKPIILQKTLAPVNIILTSIILLYLPVLCGVKVCKLVYYKILWRSLTCIKQSQYKKLEHCNEEQFLK